MKKIPNIYKTPFTMEYINLEKIISIGELEKLDNSKIHSDLGFRVICESYEHPIYLRRAVKPNEYDKLYYDEEKTKHVGTSRLIKSLNPNSKFGTTFSDNVENERQELITIWGKFLKQ